MCGYDGDPGVMGQTIDRLCDELALAKKNLGPVSFYNAQIKIIQDQNNKLRNALIACKSEAKIYSHWHIIAIVDGALEGQPNKKRPARRASLKRR